MTSKTPKLPIFETKVQQVTICVPYPCHKPKIVKEETLFWLNKTALVRLAEQYETY